MENKGYYIGDTDQIIFTRFKEWMDDNTGEVGAMGFVRNCMFDYAKIAFEAGEKSTEYMQISWEDFVMEETKRIAKNCNNSD